MEINLDTHAGLHTETEGRMTESNVCSGEITPTALGREGDSVCVHLFDNLALCFIQLKTLSELCRHMTKKFLKVWENEGKNMRVEF